jgi:hypothetical protein
MTPGDHNDLREFLLGENSKLALDHLLEDCYGFSRAARASVKLATWLENARLAIQSDDSKAVNKVRYNLRKIRRSYGVFEHVVRGLQLSDGTYANARTVRGDASEDMYLGRALALFDQKRRHQAQRARTDAIIESSRGKMREVRRTLHDMGFHSSASEIDVPPAKPRFTVIDGGKRDDDTVH